MSAQLGDTSVASSSLMPMDSVSSFSTRCDANMCFEMFLGEGASIRVCISEASLSGVGFILASME